MKSKLLEGRKMSICPGFSQSLESVVSEHFNISYNVIIQLVDPVSSLPSIEAEYISIDLISE